MDSAQIDTKSSSNWTGVEKKDAFLGLLNQGATCYLNSLLQMFFMTPEIRHGLFSLSQDELNPSLNADNNDNKNNTDHTDATLKIPAALIDLFLHLQTGHSRENLVSGHILKNNNSKLTAVSTKDVTDSFGWKDNQARIQQDISELYRLFIRVLVKNLKRTSCKDLFQLYHGKLQTQTKCRVCNYANPRFEEFMDLIVSVEGHSSLEDSLKEYFATEEMIHTSQYRCPNCAVKRDADRSLQIAELPSMLTFSLNRFRYNWNKNTREKVDTYFSFPEILDMTDYVNDSLRNTNTTRTSIENEITSTENEPSDRHIYDLNCVIVHKGSATTGHYFAYVRDVMEEVKWKNTPTDNNNTKNKAIKASSKKNKIEAKLPPISKAAITNEALDNIEKALLSSETYDMRFEELGTALSTVCAVTWRKQYRSKLGILSSFIRRYPDRFILDKDCLFVGLSKEIELNGTINSSKVNDNDNENDNDDNENENENDNENDNDDNDNNNDNDNENEEGEELKEEKTIIDETKEETTNKEKESKEDNHHKQYNWYQFNDSKVIQSDFKRISKHYGGSENAYMLVYRRRDLPILVDSNKKPTLPSWVAKEMIMKQKEMYLESITLTIQLSILSKNKLNIDKKNSLVCYVENTILYRTMSVIDFINYVKETYNKTMDEEKCHFTVHMLDITNNTMNHLLTTNCNNDIDHKNTLADYNIKRNIFEMFIEECDSSKNNNIYLATEEIKRRSCEFVCCEMNFTDMNDEICQVYIPLSSTLATLKKYVFHLNNTYLKAKGKDIKSIGALYWYDTLDNVNKHPLYDEKLQFKSIIETSEESETIGDYFKLMNKKKNMRVISLRYYDTPPCDSSHYHFQYYVSYDGIPDKTTDAYLHEITTERNITIKQLKQFICEDIAIRRCNDNSMTIDELMNKSLLGSVPFIAGFGQDKEFSQNTLIRSEDKFIHEIPVFMDDLTSTEQFIRLEIGNLRPANLVSFNIHIRNNNSYQPICDNTNNDQQKHHHHHHMESKEEESKDICYSCTLPLCPFRFERNSLMCLDDTLDVDDDMKINELKVMIESIPQVFALFNQTLIYKQQQAEEQAENEKQGEEKQQQQEEGECIQISFLDHELEPFYIAKQDNITIKQLIIAMNKRHPQIRNQSSSPYSISIPILCDVISIAEKIQTKSTFLSHVTVRHVDFNTSIEPNAHPFIGFNETSKKVFINRTEIGSLRDLKYRLIQLYPQFDDDISSMEVAIYDKRRFSWQMVPQQIQNKKKKKKKKRTRNLNQQPKMWDVIRQLNDYDVLAIRDIRENDVLELEKPKTKAIMAEKYIMEFDLYMRNHSIHPHYNVICSSYSVNTSNSNISNNSSCKSGNSVAQELFIDGGGFTSSDDDSD